MATQKEYVEAAIKRIRNWCKSTDCEIPNSAWTAIDAELQTMFEVGMKKTSQFAFCESMHATGATPWHIRKLTTQGLKFGGGADTKALCDRKVAWDLHVKITSHHLTHCCLKCAQEFKKRR